MIDSTLKNANILIVDDQQANINVLVGLLEFKGYTNLKTTTDSRLAVSLFEEFKPDLLLIDLMMPHLTGFQVMEQLKALIPIDTYFPILVLTADLTPESKQKSLSSGASDFLAKPFDLIEVDLRIKNLLNTRYLHSQMENQNQILDETSKFAENLIDTVREPLLALDQELRVVKASRSFYDFFEVNSDETIGTFIYDLGNHQWDIPKLRELLEEILPEKTTFDNYEVKHDFTSIGKRIMLLNARQIVRALGKEKIILLAIEDITERKEMEENKNVLVETSERSRQSLLSILEDEKQVQDALRESEERFRSLYENVTIGIYRTTPDGNILMANPALVKMLGYTSFQQLAERNLEIDGFEPTYERKKFIEKIERDGEVNGHDGKWILQNGTALFVLESARAIRDSQGKTLFYDGTVENITERKRTEKTLAKSEEKYRGIFENIQDVFYEISLDGTILEISPSIEIISKGGYHRDDLLGKSIYDFYSIKGGRRALLALLNERGSVTDYEVILKNPDGSHVPCSISAKIQFDSDSNPLKIIGSMRDITERKKAEEEIRESEERFRMVFENVFDGISIYSEDPDPSKRRLIECNIRYASMAGRSRDELLKLGNTAGLQITLQDRANDNRMESMERGTAYQGSFSWIRPDEKENVAEYIAIPVTWRGKIHSIGIDRDITERKRAERELRKLSRAVEQSPASIIITDLKGDIEYVNPKALELTGYRLDELIGKNPRIWSSGQTTAGEYKSLWETISSGKEWRGEFHNKKKNGILYWELASISAIINEKKEITNYLAVKEDITERKRLEQELIISKEKAEEMSRLKSSFLANMSHELRTPLIGINGFADFLRQDITDPELKEMAENIFTSGNRLSETLNHILDLSKLESDKMDFNCQEIDLVNETKNVLSLFKETARKKGLYLKISFSQASIIINTDMLSIRSILVNIINNAIKFTNEGSVAVDISLKDDFVEIKVIDSGIGVSKEYHRIIFEEFRQVSEGFSRNFEGTGLGLSITKKLIEKLGGEISVDSELGKGSVFIVKLPVTRAEEKIVIEKVEKNVLPQVKSVKPVALLVDDDPFAHSILKRYIDGQADLDSIADGEFAVQLCMKKQYDYIFMDINLGSGMDGKQVTQTIRKIKGYESIPIIATTAYVMVGDKEEFLAAGCSHYISKPFTQEIIFNLLKEILIDK